jgi:transcriptional regulator with XRE-family HTH domain
VYHAGMSVLKTYRTRQGYSQAELSRILGIPRSTLWAYESGFRVPSALRALQIEERTRGGIRRIDLRPDLFGEKSWT